MKSRYVIPKGYRVFTITILVGVMSLKFFGVFDEISLFQNFLWDLGCLIYFASELYHEEFDKVKIRGYDWWLHRIATTVFSILTFMWIIYYVGGLQ